MNKKLVTLEWRRLIDKLAHEVPNLYICVFIFIVVFSILAFMAPYIVSNTGLIGDEPTYYNTAYSILHDGDVDLRNNLSPDVYTSYGATVGPWYVSNKHGKAVPAFMPGLPVLIAPGLLFPDSLGVVWILCFLMSFTAVNIYLLFYSIAENKVVAFIVFIVVFFSPPLITISFTAFPEVPAVLFITLALRYLIGQKSTKGIMYVSFSAGVLPWLHVKYAILSVLISVFMLIKIRDSIKKVILFTILPLLSLGLFTCYMLNNYGQLILPIYGKDLLVLEYSKLGLPGLLFDGEKGLLINAPVYLCGIIGVLFCFRNKRYDSFVLLVIFVTFWILVAAHSLNGRMGWWGGGSPPTRFLIPVIPILGYFIVKYLIRFKWFGWILFLPLACISLYMGWCYIKSPTIINVCFNGSADALQKLPFADHIIKYMVFFPNPDDPLKKPEFSVLNLVRIIAVVVGILLVHVIYIYYEKRKIRQIP